MNQPPTSPFRYPLSIAPMMQRTDRHYRYFMRMLTRRTLLYTEMVTMHAILRGDADRLLGYDALEHPIALQVGGDDPTMLARCARIAAERGYDEINLNIGCPSERVQSGNFGACLMAEPELVARCVEAMRGACDIEVTVKHRIGIDEIDRYDDMARFVRTVRDAGGCTRFTVHARKAWLKGLSPKENRNVPPLRYEEVWRLKEAFPGLVVEINGGIKTLDQAREHLAHVDAVMIGRAAYDDPYLFARADAEIFGDASRPTPGRHEAVEAMLPYIDRWTRGDDRVKLSSITRHMLQLFASQPGARSWRRHLSENAWREEAGAHTVVEALAMVPRPQVATGEAVPG